MDNPHEHLAEIHRLTVKAASRCAYDLKHAAHDIREENKIVDYNQRADMWLNLFTPDGTKNYRDELHREIFNLEMTIDKYKKLCKEHGVDYSHIETPF